METIKQLGAYVEKRRNQLRMTQKGLCNLAGISDATLRGIEQGKPGVAIKNWAAVADVLGLELKFSVKRMSDETRKGNE
mgnify:CR=1 FL=1